MTQKQIVDWDIFFETRHEKIFNKYLKRYKENG